MNNNEQFGTLADDAAIARAMDALRENGMEAMVVENGAAAVQKVLEMIPQGAEVFNMQSTTLVQLGLDKEFATSGKYESVREKLTSMDRATQGREMQRLGAAPQWAIGSVHAVTEDGHVFVASATGSQLPAYAFGAEHVLWVVGTQKIVKDDAEALQRIREYTFPLEDARAQKAYGVGSGINKMLTVNKEKQAGRIMILFVKEKLGF